VVVQPVVVVVVGEDVGSAGHYPDVDVIKNFFFSSSVAFRQPKLQCFPWQAFPALERSLPLERFTLRCHLNVDTCYTRND
jgi:hypothetical protein